MAQLAWGCINKIFKLETEKLKMEGTKENKQLARVRVRYDMHIYEGPVVARNLSQPKQELS